MYYKTLRIFLREMNKLHTKLVRMSKPVKVTDNNKDTLVSYATKFFTAITTFIVQATEEMLHRFSLSREH